MSLGVSGSSCFGNDEAKLFMCQMGLAGFSSSEQCTLALANYSLKHGLHAASSNVLRINYRTSIMYEKDLFMKL